MFECIAHVYLHIISIIHFLDLNIAVCSEVIICYGMEGSSSMMAVWVMVKSQRKNVRVIVSGHPAHGGPLPIPTHLSSVSRKTSVHARRDFSYPPFYFPHQIQNSHHTRA